MRYTSQQFDFNTATQVYSKEASLLNSHQIYGTLASGEKGIYIDEAEFMFVGLDKDDGDEDIFGWKFKPTMDAVSKNPSFAGKTALIKND